MKHFIKFKKAIILFSLFFISISLISLLKKDNKKLALIENNHAKNMKKVSKTKESNKDLNQDSTSYEKQTNSFYETFHNKISHINFNEENFFKEELKNFTEIKKRHSLLSKNIFRKDNLEYNPNPKSKMVNRVKALYYFEKAIKYATLSETQELMDNTWAIIESQQNNKDYNSNIVYLDLSELLVPLFGKSNPEKNYLKIKNINDNKLKKLLTTFFMVSEMRTKRLSFKETARLYPGLNYEI